MYKLLGLVFIVFSIASFFALCAITPFSPSLNTAHLPPVSSTIYALNSLTDILLQCIGYAAFLIPLPFFLWGRRLFIRVQTPLMPLRILAFFLSMLLSPLILISVFSPYHGGMLGYFASLWFHLGVFVIPLSLVALLCYLFSLGFSLNFYGAFFKGLVLSLDTFIYYARHFLKNLGYSFSTPTPLPSITDSLVRTSIRYPNTKESSTLFTADLALDTKKNAIFSPEDVVKHDALLQDSPLLADIYAYEHHLNAEPQSPPSSPTPSDYSTHYTPPALTLLQDAPKKSNASPANLEKQAHALLLAIKEFGVKGEITRIQPGPVVTLFEFLPASGVKVSKVIALEADIARKMEALSVRIAPIAGRNVVGIEIPSPVRQSVYLRTLFQSPNFSKSSYGLPIALGEDISGLPTIVDLTTMPHLLIAGTTGSGKSVAVNTMILSLLYCLSPADCRLIMIDPKMLELSVYQDIPHLLTPVVTDSEKALSALKWAVKEMENRYRLMSQLSVRNIAGYNEKIRTSPTPITITQIVATGVDDDGRTLTDAINVPVHPLPFIVVIIDEVADLMMVAGKEVEWAVQRLAQMARAAGIHVIMATQRPSVDVITGTIKANFPARISFQVSSKIDSRTILGEQGAEQLLGKGDMLYMPGVGRLQRLHGAFVADGEVEAIVASLKKRYPPQYVDNIFQGLDSSLESSASGVDIKDKDVDPLYMQALSLIRSEGKVSTSFIQRQFQIGYNRAARIVEAMEDNGVISKANAVGKRDVL